MGSVEEEIDRNDFERERLASYALKQNPRMKDFGDFKEALLDAFSIGRGKNFPFLDDEYIKKLFESTTIQETIFQNNPEGYDEANQEAKDFQLVRGDGRLYEARMIYAPKRVVKTPYVRDGKRIKTYESTYSKWTPAQKKFIDAELARKTTTKEIIRKYNIHFASQNKTPSSIKTRIYRQKKS